MNKCQICKEMFSDSDTYEYRGAMSCQPHFEELQGKRDYQRQEVIEENEHQTAPFKGLSLGDNVIGRANRQILKGSIEIAKKETMRTKLYEQGIL